MMHRSAPTKWTENKELSGLAGVIEAFRYFVFVGIAADNATFSTKLQRFSSMGLMALLPVAFVLSPSPLAMPVDLALGAILPIHAHIGMNNVISDYVPKRMRTLARVSWLGVTAVMFLGLLRVNIEGPGLTECIKTSVQHLVAKIPAQPAARQLTESGAHRRWLETYRGTNTFRGQTQLNKDGFDAFVREVAVYLQKLEDEAFQSSGKIGALQESDLDSAEAEAYVEAIKLKMSRHMCMQAATCFELLDRDNDGWWMALSMAVTDTAQQESVSISGLTLSGLALLPGQFRLYDADGDEIVTEAETKLILESMIATQKAVMTELFGNNVDCLPKKHEKLFAKSLSEEDWKSKIPEKVRCVFHFANKLDEKRKTLDWELFEESQMFVKRAAQALALLFAVVLLAHAAEFEEEDDVLVLTDDNFEDAVAGHDTLLVEFYAPWCGHCKKLAPEYATAAKALKELDPPIRLAKLDATAATKAAEQFAIRGFPTLKFFKGDVAAVKDYDGGRTSDEIQKWVVKKSGPAVKIVETAEELEEIKAANDVVVFAVVDAEEGDARSLLEKVADSDDLAVYVASTSTDITEDAAAANKVVLYKKFDEGKVVYEGEFEKEALSEFVKANSLPLVVMFSQEKAPMIFGGDMTEHVLAFVDTSKDYVAGIEAALKTPAKANKGKLLHVIMPHTEKRIVDYFGLKEEEMPAVMLVNMAGGMKKYGFDYKGDDLVAKVEDGLAEDLTAFEQRYFDGEVTPLLKSAEHEDDSDEAVKVIVGKEFEERVVNNEKDVLLEFYAPWCGHCKALAPKYEELAEAFADVESIMIAKMDATENEVDHPGVDVRGFPTLLFFPAKDKQNPIVYEGARDVEGLTEFLKTNAQKFELEGSEHGVEHEEL
ncbi:hypothetical protein BBJ28_00012053 [Nothophytophthora sp. Chile5]|nr:hypothetical protein BBJ28_00012053 [Nothophytophthora sp. Chile5]